MNGLGQHLLMDFFNCKIDVINDVEQIRKHMVEAASLAQATIVKEVFHTFSPHGVSGVVVIAESHLAIHTWPEYGTAAVDMFTCSPKMNSQVVHDYLKKVFHASTSKVTLVNRGVL